MKKLFLLLVFISNIIWAQNPNTDQSKFKQLGTELTGPNSYRTASGAPGHEYWQQRADYNIKVELDDEKQKITGQETITYYNNSPDPLTYIWLQLDQNVVDRQSDSYKIETGTFNDKLSFEDVRAQTDTSFDGGHKISFVKDGAGNPLKYTINKTMMRVDLRQPLQARGGKIILNIAWYYNINNRDDAALANDSRGGYEYFAEDGNYLYSITQWFPRLAVYRDDAGWQHKQFLGQGEFALVFGNYNVAITVPSDHIVAATGVLQNPAQVLGPIEAKRFEQAKNADKPVVIVTQEEATLKEKTHAKTKKTWQFKAENVRDFAFGSSRKFIWDAMGVKLDGRNDKVMAMSFYAKEANPLYGQYSTEAVAHTLRTYSKYTFPFPYPTAISVEASSGMEYPMICFNYGRPDKDGTYSERIKYGMLSVVFHEVGHNFFPMIVNSDERQWSWMDEGLNSFLQYITEQEWQRDYPSNRGVPKNIVNYMKLDKSAQNPIMVNSESIIRFGDNAYGKPAAALNILRETVMGRELFDYAFKEYARRWKFKHPSPPDFFRTMEDASAVDLDWFWRGWFYTTDNVDISLDKIIEFRPDSKNPDLEKPLAGEKAKKELENNLTYQNNKKYIPQVATEKNEDLKDFYNSYNRFAVTNADKENYNKYIASLSPEEKEIIQGKKHFYQLDFSNKGGLVMPLILEFTFEDGTKKTHRIPAEIWLKNNEKVSKIFAFEKAVSAVVLDPHLETADIDTENNYFPRIVSPGKFELFKQKNAARGQSQGANPMQQQKKEVK